MKALARTLLGAWVLGLTIAVVLLVASPVFASDLTVEFVSTIPESAQMGFWAGFVSGVASTGYVHCPGPDNNLNLTGGLLRSKVEMIVNTTPGQRTQSIIVVARQAMRELGCVAVP